MERERKQGSCTTSPVPRGGWAAFLVGLFAVVCSTSALSGVAIDNKPLTVTNSVPGNLVLLPSVEWPTVVTHANAPGTPETSANYSASTAYAGYFNSSLCYAYHFDVVEENRYFYPVRATAANHSCAGFTAPVGDTGQTQGLWSGNFLNWSAMQAIDTFRLALTGGYRVHRPADGTPANGYSEMDHVTYLEKANSDRWENQYTPLRRLTANAGNSTPSQTSTFRTRIGALRNQMWFIPSSNGNLGYSGGGWNCPKPMPRPVTDGLQSVEDWNSDQHGNCTTRNSTTTAVPYNPLYHTLPNTDTTTYIDDVPCNVDAGEFGCQSSGRNRWRHTNYGRNQVYAVSIRVQVCDGVLDTRSLCVPYGSNYKPEGLLQQNSRKTRYSLFAYLTESGASRTGGVMRARQKLIGPVTPLEEAGTEKPYPDRTRMTGIDNAEWDLATGKIINDPDTADSSATSAAVGACNNAPDGSGCRIRYSGVINYLNRFGQINTGMTTLKAHDNLAEMYYTALRYLRGDPNIAAYSNLSGDGLANYQNADGLPVISDWFGTGANAGVTRWNADPENPRAVGTDRDPILYQCQPTVMLGIGDTSTQQERDAHSSDNTSNAVTWRGYTEWNASPASRGNLAGLAYWAHLNDLRPDIPNTTLSVSPARARGQTTSTYWVDVVERADLLNNNSNQYYNATKYGGYTIPDDHWGADGNASRPDAAWFSNNLSAWTSATQTIGNATSGLNNGNFRLPNNMYLANNGQAMIDGLNAAFQKIADDISGSGGSFASNSTKLETGSRTYQAKYASNGWGGQLIASDVNVANGTLTPRWDASDWLGHAPGQTKVNTAAPSWNFTQRKLLYNSSGTLAQFITNWNNYTNVTSPTIAKPAGLSGVTNEQLRYLLGDRLHERQSVAPDSERIFRNRRGMLGDIINSQPVYVGRPNANLHSDDPTYAAFAAARASRKPVVYVGANDGMLHAFYAPDAADTANAAEGGKELFAFMPTAAMGILTQDDPSSNKYPYWHPEYDHAYSVDGELTVADVKDGTTWKTVLVGTMGRGGTGVFALDVTDPDAPQLLWEKTATDVPELGNVLGRPIIAKVGEGDWRVFLGNGPNNANERAALVMFDVMDGDATVIDTGAAGSEGLSAVNVWDAHGATEDDLRDGLFDTVYAGDMGGNLWKFKIGAGTATRLFAAGSTQPITAAPLVASNPYSPPDTWVFFGTGQYLSMADINEASNQNVQSWYGMIDRGTQITKATLNRVRITAQDSVGRVIERAGVAGTNGWYIDLQSPEEAAGTVARRGERMVLPNFFQGMVLIGTTRFPDSTDPCAPAGKGFTMAIDPFTGGRLSNAFFDINQSGTVGDSGDYHGGNTDTPYSGIAYDSGPNNPIFLGEYMYTSLDDGSYSQFKTGSGAASVKRVSWRELLNEM